MKRRHGERASKPSGKRTVENSSRQRSKTVGESVAGRWRRVGFVLVGVALLLVAVYSVLPKDFTGPSHKDSEEVQREMMAERTKRMGREQGEREGDEEEEDEWRDTGVSCDRLMSEAKMILDHEPERNWETALDLLAACVLQEPENPKPRWNLAVALIRMNRSEEALNFIDEAISLDPSNVDYLRSGGAVLSQMGYHKEAIQCLEWFLELSLHVPSWEELLASISIQREDEWTFLYEAGENVTQVFELLLHSYLQDRQLIKSGYMYKVLIGLKGAATEPALLAAYSFFALGLGDILTGMKYLRLYTEMQYLSQGYGNEEQAYEVVAAHCLRLLSAGFDSYIIGLGRNLLMVGQAAWDEMVYNCELPEGDGIEFTATVRQEDLRRVFIKCLLVQNVIPQLVQDGAVVYAENIFGWTPLLHAAALGSPDIVQQLIHHNADYQVRTVLAHTSLHIAAIRGSYGIVLPLIQAGLSPGEVDYFNRTAMQVACLHRWTAGGMAEALKVSMPHGCPSKLKYTPPPKHSAQGGWLGSGVALPASLARERCDIDVIPHDADVQQFLFDYLALQRPVLVRGAANTPEMKAFFTAWQRNKLEHEHGALLFKVAAVPYAEVFGYNSTQTPLKAFMGRIKQLFHENKDLKTYAAVLHPSFIYETIQPDSPLLAHFRIPSILNPNKTHINMANLYFFLGPAFSGTPPHFHRSAWNVLVYGQMRWFLFPPPLAMYTKQSAWDWWLASQGHTEGALECMQYPGDLLFVPDMWGQASVSLRESIGLASEFVYGASEFSI